MTDTMLTNRDRGQRAARALDTYPYPVDWRSNSSRAIANLIRDLHHLHDYFLDPSSDVGWDEILDEAKRFYEVELRVAVQQIGEPRTVDVDRAFYAPPLPTPPPSDEARVVATAGTIVIVEFRGIRAAYQRIEAGEPIPTDSGRR